MPTLPEMKARLNELEKAIKETEARLPAHSVKPPVMLDLLALEDEYENLVQQIRAFKIGCDDKQGNENGRPEACQ